MAKLKITAVNRTENLFKFILEADGNVINHTEITEAALRNSLGTTLADSAVDSSDWDFTNAGFLTVKLGLTDSSPGEHECKLIVKTATYPVGLAWDDTDLILTILP